MSEISKTRERDPKSGERGSALLIVFVFAAAVAIMLYMEMPVAVFEAQREKEQLLIDRGNEYAHGVKLFVRKVGNYPPSLDALENTNRMRFLRHRYKDPITGKEDWRLLHAGPGGMLIDSKVKPVQTVGQGTNAAKSGNTGAFSIGTFSSSTTSGMNSSNPASLSSFASSSSSSEAEVAVTPVPQRAPAVSASGNASPTSVTDLNNPALASMRLNQTDPAANPQQVNADGTSASPGLPNPGAPGAAQPGINGATGTAASGVPGGAPAQTDGAAATQAVRGLAANPNSPAAGTNQAAVAGQNGGPNAGRTMSGGLAGVASLAKGHAIKTVNEQTDFSLWEFYYDPTKDALKMNTGLQGAGGSNNRTGAAGTQNSMFGNSSTTPSTSTSGSTGFFTSTPNSSSGTTNSGTSATQRSQGMNPAQPGLPQQTPPN